jgi:hypothetical protein
MQLRARFSLIVSPSVFSAQPKKTPLWAVVTKTGRPFTGVFICSLHLAERGE